jgi:hypothetical protein
VVGTIWFEGAPKLGRDGRALVSVRLKRPGKTCDARFSLLVLDLREHEPPSQRKSGGGRDCEGGYDSWHIANAFLMLGYTRSLRFVESRNYI